MRLRTISALGILGGVSAFLTDSLTASAQEVDQVSAPNQVNVGAAMGIVEQLGDGVGDVDTFGSSRYIIARDPARAVRRGRNLFQRKFKHSEGAGPRTNDGNGPIQDPNDPTAPVFDNSVGAGLADSCALCHGRPRGSAGFGGDVFTRPDSRDAPHLFGLGIQEQLADEITTELRAIRDAAIDQAINGMPGGLTGLQARILGFEDVGSDWSVSIGGSIGSSSTATQGNRSLAVTPNGWTEINTMVAGLQNISSQLTYDIRLPGPVNWGETRVILIAPSRAVWWSQVGARSLVGLPSGQFVKISFPIPSSLRNALEGAPDLTIKLVVNGPTFGQPYLVDNMKMAEGGGGDGGGPVTVDLISKGVNYGKLHVDENGIVDTSDVEGVNPDLRVRPFFAEGTTISMREFAVGAFNAEMGIQITDSIINTAAGGGVTMSPSGMVFDGTIDVFESSPLPEATDPDNTEPNAPGLGDDAGEALIDFMEFYLLNYFKPGHYKETGNSVAGRALFNQVGCNDCHKADFVIDSDRRVADVETNHRSFFAPPDRPPEGVFNNLFAVATGFFAPVPGSEDDLGFPIIAPLGQPFVVEDIFTDFKRHDLGIQLHERNFDNTLHTEFMTEALWGVGSSAPYGHDGRSINLMEIILRHGGEAADARKKFERLSSQKQDLIFDFLNTLILFPPEDTASNLNAPGDIDPTNPDFPQRAHGNIKLPALFQIPQEGPE